MIRLLTVLLVLPLVFALGVRPVAAQSTMRPAAVVNDEVISVFDLEMRIRMALVSSGLEGNPENARRLSAPVLRQLVDETLQLQEAERLDISVPQEEVESAVATLAERNEMPVERFRGLLQRNGILVEALERQVRASLAWREVVVRRLRPSVEVSEEEVDEAVERLRRELGSPQVRIAEIFMAVDNPQDEAEVRQTAQRLVEQIREGASFSSVAAQFSQAATASVGGDLGWMSPTQLAPEIAETVAQMQPRSLAGPIRSLGGYYIILLRDRRSPQTRAEATLRLSQILFPVERGELEAVSARAREATADIQSCAQAETLAEQIGAPGSGNLGEVKLGDLPDRVRTAIANLPVGQPSAPIVVGDAVSVLVVCSRQGGEAEIDRERVRDDLLRERLEMQARRYMRDLRRAANVDIRV